MAAAAAPPERKKVVKEPDRVLIVGEPDYERVDNKVVSARYTPITFFPKAILEQFRRFANLYFLIVGCIMFLGYYTDLYESAISPWTTLGPLAFVIAVSLLVEGSSDLKRHKNDHETNNYPCVILQNTGELDVDEKAERDERICGGRDVTVDVNKAFYAAASGSGSGPYNRKSSADDPDAKNVKVAFQKVTRQDIRQGHLILVKNREMVPADIVLLASSNDHGSAYIETSSIDGETNLKLRNSPHLPKNVVKALREGQAMESITEEYEKEREEPEDAKLEPEIETIETATKRLTRMTVLGWPHGQSALEHPSIMAKKKGAAAVAEEPSSPSELIAEPTPSPAAARRRSSVKQFMKDARTGLTAGVDAIRGNRSSDFADENGGGGDDRQTHYVAALTTEPPNASVHTFSGKLTLPSFGESVPPYDIPLGAENVLLRGAVVRNTEWVIGVAFFTGTDTKLVQNSFATPSKFSQLDRLMNFTVRIILFVMICIISYLATQGVVTTNRDFDEMFYAGLNKNSSEPWPYLPELEAPDWETSSNNWIQFFLLYVTLLSNFIPLSLYVTVELVTYCMLYFVYSDLEMYDPSTNTRALARSTIISDLGRIQYIFSDKTGTLTQNVMRFKRCSVDGMVFGTPIQRTRPGAEDVQEEQSPFHPLRQLLVGRFKRGRGTEAGLEGLGGTSWDETDNTLTFNSEMFLRVMSLCHTVVVEKDIDKKEDIGSAISQASSHGTSRSLGSYAKKFWKGNRSRTNTNGSAGPSPALSSVAEDSELPEDIAMVRARTTSVNSLAPGENASLAKNTDGAPLGYAYQAESPDEGALVSAASLTYGFQVIGRDSNGIRLRCGSQSHLQNGSVAEGLRSKKLTLNRLAAETAAELPEPDELGSNGGGEWTSSAGLKVDTSLPTTEQREETWTILAVNKFDSDRKRMSILLRSPPELGGLPILFCKGADSAMLDPEVCGDAPMLQPDGAMKTSLSIPRPSTVADRGRDVSALTTVSETEDEDDVDQDGWEMAQMLGIQVHLGEFAKEGLRTLVLGMRVLSEEECTEWLDFYKSAATSIKDRAELLTEAAKRIERDLHIVGATAIEDKLQRRVPETISTLEKAGIKLWVLTGDKRETAVEIGYSTHVLTPKMHLTEVPDGGKQHVRTQMAMEFIRLTKHGRLPEYQKAAIGVVSGKHTWGQRWEIFKFKVGKCRRSWRRFVRLVVAWIMSLFCMKEAAAAKKEWIAELEEAEKKIVLATERRRKVREKADMTIKSWLESEEGSKYRERRRSSVHPQHPEDEELTLTSEETPQVFNRASSARTLLADIRRSGELSQPELRNLTIAALTAQQASLGGGGDAPPIVDEDTLSLESFVPADKGDLRGDFDRKKRTLLERMFAVDRSVRKGRLRKHLKKERLAAITEEKEEASRRKSLEGPKADGPRALVIEGAALKHLLNDDEYAEMLFAVASNCEAVIACRVSPKQKAELVNLVRHNVTPEPITLAIGDGANDVGMIQEAHVGVGISGREGKQAVNASDFAIGQFRFLDPLVLIHGRWNFFRLSQVVLFSFYKNAVMAGTIVVFSARTKYSGTPLYDQWVIAVLNFVAAFPIIMLGLFDRCLSKNYVRKNPEVYKATRENQLITMRTLLRWIIITFVHIFILYYFTVPVQSEGAGITPAFEGLMRNKNEDAPGNGEGGDLKSVGTVTFTCLIIMLAYKVLYETRSLVHGRWPAFTCRKGVGEGFMSRLAYTWIGVTYLSIGFYLVFLAIYQVIGRSGPGLFSDFVDVANHVLGTRSLNWMLIVFVPIFAEVADVCGKVFSNMYYPTQTQIHLEIESKGKVMARRRGLGRVRRAMSWRHDPEMHEP